MKFVMSKRDRLPQLYGEFASVGVRSFTTSAPFDVSGPSTKPPNYPTNFLTVITSGSTKRILSLVLISLSCPFSYLPIPSIDRYGAS
jgi:hypothetical protein